MQTGVDKQGVYRNVELGFSFTPPGGMHDKTATANPADEKKDPNTIELLLFELSGPDDAALDWRALAVQSYPRDQVPTKDDVEAEAKLSRTIIGKSATPMGAPAKLTINDIGYVLSRFQGAHGAVTEYSYVYATIIRGQMVAFAFTSNSTAQAEEMAEALKTLKVEPQKTSFLQLGLVPHYERVSG